MANGVFVPIVGDPDSLIKALRKSEEELGRFGKAAKQTSDKVSDSADRQVRATVALDARLRQQVAAYQRVASAAEKGSREQIAATNLAAQAQARLARSLSVTDREQQQLNRHTEQFGKASRGALVGTGAAGKLGRSAAFASTGFIAGFSFTALAKSIVTQATTIQEETEKTDVLFGESAKQVQAWAQTLASSFGVSESAALASSGIFGNMFRSLKFGQADAAKMSQRLVELAADMASFNNASPADTLAALQSGLAGQVRPLRQFGVFLSQDRIKAEALSSGISTNVAHLTSAQKVLASYNIILKDTGLQQGDVARNTQSLSVAQSKLSAEIANNQAKIGKGLTPALTDLTNESAKTAHALSPVAQGSAIALTIGLKALNLGIKTMTVDWKPVTFAVQQFAAALRDADKAASGFKPLRGPRGTQTTPFVVPGVRGAFDPGLHAQFQTSQLSLAQAQLTKTTADDRKVLAEQSRIIRAAIAKTTNQAKLLDLTKQLGQIDAQIRAIDQDNADKQAAAADKQAAAAKKALDKRNAQQKKLEDAAKKQADRERAARKKARDQALAAIKEARAQAQQTTASFRELIQTERQRIGDLFGGPIFNPSDAQRKSALGAPTPGSNAKLLVADLKAQIAQFKNFERDLTKLAKRGAPPQLLQELRQQGLAVAPQVHALATAGAGTFAQFKGLFIQREKLAVQAAKAARPIINLTVIVNKDTGHVSVRTTPHGQKRGRNPGVVIQGGVVRGD